MFISHNHFSCHPTLTSVWIEREDIAECPAYLPYSSRILLPPLCSHRTLQIQETEIALMWTGSIYRCITLFATPVSYQSIKSVRVFVCLNSSIRCTVLLDLSTPYHVNPTLVDQIWNLDMTMRIASYVQDMIPNFRSFLVHLSHESSIRNTTTRPLI